MRKLFIFALLVCFLFAGCNGDLYTGAEKSEETTGGGETTDETTGGDEKTDDKPVEKDYVSINLALKGDFNDFTAGAAVNSDNWGCNNAEIVADGKDGNGVEMEGSSVVFYNSYSVFKSSAVTASVDVKLSDASQADKVELVVEFCDGSSQPYKNGAFSAKAVPTTDWQEITLTVAIDDVKKFDAHKVTVKVVKTAEDGDASTILVDNIKMTVQDNTAVNFLPFGKFLGNLEGKWRTVAHKEGKADVWEDSTVKGVDGRNAVELPYGEYELITSNVWIAGGNSGARYDTTLDGEVSFSAKGAGTITFFIEKKNSDSDVTVSDIELMITDEWATYTVSIPKEDKAYNETTFKIKTSRGVGKVYITDVFLHYTEGK